jgi:GntR family transcriptional regulator/MocR family aminotransferase
MDYALLLANFATTDAQPSWSQQRLLHECLRAAIRSGTLHAGCRLLATRQLAAELGMARNTILYAFEQLATEGFVVTDRRGTFVAHLNVAPPQRAGAGTLGHPGLSARAACALPPSDPATMSAFAPGVPSLDDFPIAIWRRLLDRAWRALAASQLNYGDPAGEPALRSAIADHLRAARGVLCEPSQVFITDGTQNALDLCSRSLADAGDVVWIENPGYRGALTAFRNAELRVVAIDVDEHGLAPSAADWRDHPPKLIYVTPSHQYPFGGVLSVCRRLALIEQAKAVGALIIEDDYDSEFRYDGPPLSAMQGLAPNAPVLYLGTFSKTMFPALRIGFMVVPPSLATPLAQYVARSAPRGRAADQLALAEFLRTGQFATHLRRMRRLYRQRRDALGAAVERHFGASATLCGSSAGIHLALVLGAEVPDARVSAAALEQGMIVNALSSHAIGPAQAARNGFVLGYAQVPASAMDASVRQLAALVQQYRQKAAPL